MSVHAFIDETMRNGYFVAAAMLLPGDLAQARKAINGLLLAGQRRLHFYTENVNRRRRIIATIAALGPEVVIYNGSAHKRDLDARRACLEGLVGDLAAKGAHRLVIERDDSLVDRDRRILFSCIREQGCADRLAYVHMRAHEECLLAIPDAVAWCWTRGGEWRHLVRELVTRVEEV